MIIDQIRLEFEDWYSKQRRDPHANWHPPETLTYDRNKYPTGRYTVMSQKQSSWEVWQAAWARKEELKNSPTHEIVEAPNGKQVSIYCHTIPLTPHNSSRNHTDAVIDSEAEAKENGISYIPEAEGEYWTAEQILEYMVKNLRGEDLLTVLKVEKESDMIQFHSSVGRWIRNTFKIWDPKNPHLDGMHPDEMSTEILKGIWRTVVRREMIGM